MSLIDSIKNKFNPSVKREGTNLFSFLKNRFGQDTAVKVDNFFKKINLPVPESDGEFMRGQEGGLVFLNRYGLVIRIEVSDMKKAVNNPVRVNDSPWIIKPFASIDAGEATIEICPGIRQSKKKRNNEYLKDQLKQRGIDFWDCKFSNIGNIPIKTWDFPNGMEVVIDRLAVTKLTESIRPIGEAMKAIDTELMQAQEKLYGPLRQAIDNAWPDKSGYPDAGKMAEFFDLCSQYTKEEKLCAGWNDTQAEEALHERCEFGSNNKTPKAAKVAERYEARIEAFRQQPRSIFAAMGKLLHKTV